MPVRGDAQPLQPVLGRAQRIVVRLLQQRHHARHRVARRHPQRLTRLLGELRVGAAPVHQPVQEVLLPLQVAALQPGALPPVGLHQRGVLHIQRRPQPLPGQQQQMLVDVDLVVPAQPQQRLPQGAGAQVVGVEHPVQRHPLAGPGPPGLPPQLHRVLLRRRQPRHGLNAAPHVLPGGAALVGLQLGGLLAPVGVGLQQHPGDLLGDPVHLRQQQRKRPGDGAFGLRIQPRDPRRPHGLPGGPLPVTHSSEHATAFRIRQTSL